MIDATASESTDARQYAKIRYRLLLIEFALIVAFLSTVQFTGVSQAISHWWSARVAKVPLVILGYLLSFGSLYYLVTFPLHVYGSFILEHRFGLSRMTLTDWGVREAKQLGVSALLGAFLVEGFYALLRIAPRQWPCWATIGWMVFSIVLARMFPTVVLPIFYKVTPLPDEALAKKLLALCQRVRLPALGVFRFDLGVETRKANAALAGLGTTRRVLLSDTLMTEFTPDEIEGVLAHELAHHRYQHIAKLLVLSAVGSWIAFTLTNVVGRWWVAPLGLDSLADIGGFPVLMLWLSIFGFMGMPLQNGVSRYFEWEADHFAVAMTTVPKAFASALRRLATLNLADPHPPRWIVWWFYDHPPITERIHAAEHPRAEKISARPEVSGTG